jgi:hypothetical protein
MHMAVRTAKITAVLLIPYPSMIGSADAGVTGLGGGCLHAANPADWRAIG